MNVSNLGKESLEDLQSLIDSITDMIFVLDLKGNILKANPMVLKRLKYSEQKILKKHLVDLHPLEFHEEARLIFKQIIEGKTDICPIPLIDIYGTLIPVETKAVRVKWNNQEVIFGISRDISEKIKMKRKVVESESKYTTLLDNISDIVVEVNGSMKISYVNSHIQEMLGYRPEQVIGLNISQLAHPEDMSEISREIEEAIKSKRVISAEYRIKHEKGHYITAHVRGNVIVQKDNYKFIGVIRDSTNQKIAEQKLKESEKKYREAFEQATFYKDILAHDILNILQNIKSSHELLILFNNIADHQEQKIEFLDIIEEQVNRGKELIKNVRKLSEVDESRVSLKIMDAITILKASIEFVKNSFSRKKISIILSTPHESIKIRGNDLLRDVFENILFNAIIYNRNSIAKIHVFISQVKKKNKNYFKFEFKDNARGISDDMKELVFNQGYIQEKHSKGMGLGLFLVKKIIESYGGEIWVEDKVTGDHKKGSNFVLLIPKARGK
ncbi:MAG: PAS domain S-box protein [Promethearchaeota archaeon]